MKTNYKTYILATLALGAVLSTASAQTAEYDDMYFSPKDRVDKEKKVAKENYRLQKIEESVTIDPEESYSQKNVNPEYLAKYKADQEESDKGQTYAEDEYFNENYNAQAQNGTGVINDADVVVRDRFGNTTYFRDSRDLMWNDPFMARGAAFDPFWGPSFGWNRFRPGWNVNIGMGWNSWNRWNTGFGISYGWGNPWGFHDPFFNPWMRGGMGFGFYDPWFYDPFFCPSPFRNNVVLINNYETRSNRTISRGAGPSRSVAGTRSSGRRTNTVTDNPAAVSRGRTSGRTASRTSRYASNSRRSDSYSSSTRSASRDNQSGYYRRSRPSTRDNSAVSQTSSRSSRSSYANSRSGSRSTSNYSRSSRSSYQDAQRSRSRSSSSRSGYNNSSRSRSSNSFSRPSNSSRSRSSYSRPSSGSRSMGSYNSGSRSRSSYSSPSRSTGRSSGSRSSSSRRRN